MRQSEEVLGRQRRDPRFPDTFEAIPASRPKHRTGSPGTVPGSAHPGRNASHCLPLAQITLCNYGASDALDQRPAAGAPYHGYREFRRRDRQAEAVHAGAQDPGVAFWNTGYEGPKLEREPTRSRSQQRATRQPGSVAFDGVSASRSADLRSIG